MSISTNFPTIKPSLLLDFANVGALDPRITFTRASTGTYYDGVTTAKAEENLLLQSQDFTTSWTTEDATITANTAVAPDGTTTADTITENTANTDHRVKSGAISFVSGQSYVISVFAKNGDADFIQIVLPSTAFGAKYANFDIDTGVVGSFDTTTATITLVGNGWYRLVVTATATSTTTVDFSIGLANSSSLGRLAAYTGTSRFAYLWGAQLEQRSAVTAYTATTTQPITNYIPVLQTAAANVARFDHTPTTGEALGLLVEEQRTNLVTYSSEFSNAAWTKTNATITADTIVAPDGTLTGDFIGETVTVGGTHRVRNATVLSVSGNTSYTCTVYAKAGFGAVRYLGIGLSDSTSISSGARRSYVFDLSTGAITTTGGATWTLVSGSATLVGNGWYRCQITVTTDASASNMYASIGLADSFSATSFAAGYDGDGYSGIFIWGAQLEAGAFPTSYTATTSAQVTRSADAASMTGTNFSSWFNNAEGTVYSEFMRNTTANAIAGGGNTVPRIYSFGTSASGSLQLRLFSSTGAEATGPSMYIANTWAANQYNKHALAFEVNDAALVRDGGSVVSDSTVTALTADTLAIGQNTIGSGNIGQGWIRKLSYYPQRLTDAQLQAITS